MVTGNWLDSLDSLIESVSIYNVGKNPCCDVMVYITITGNKVVCAFSKRISQKMNVITLLGIEDAFF